MAVELLIHCLPEHITLIASSLPLEHAAVDRSTTPSPAIAGAEAATLGGAAVESTTPRCMPIIDPSLPKPTVVDPRRSATMGVVSTTPR